MKIVSVGGGEPIGTRRAHKHNSMKLYYFPGACALADHIVLEWIGTPYETVRMSQASIKTPDYLAINPGGTVPLLIDGNFSLTENFAILSYLADLNPGAHLFGDGTPRGRAEVMRWLGFLNSDVHSEFKPIFTPGRFLPDPAAANAIVDTTKKVTWSSTASRQVASKRGRVLSAVQGHTLMNMAARNRELT